MTGLKLSFISGPHERVMPLIDGRVRVDAYRQTFVDEPRLYAQVQEIGEKLQRRTGTTFPRSRWPIL